MEANLPIQLIRNEFVETLSQSNRCILRAPAGSGKSTLIPQFLLDDVIPAQKTVIVLQPRRIAARMLASFVAGQRLRPLGDEVGYQVRLENAQSANTRLLFVTEGILLNRLLRNDLLNEAGAIIFDEFHERHLETDISLALALKLQQQHRPDLKLVVMSATLETERLKEYLHPCPVLETEGRAYPVEILYRQPKPYETVWDFAALQLEAALPLFTEGSALIFMPGAFEIKKALESIQRRQSLQHFEIYPLYGSLTKDEQDKAVREGGRKIIVTTNVAETSLTIPGIRLVIDSGLARVARFDPKRGINTLFVEKISQSSASQRAGRAGRTAPGTCVRLWSEFEHQNKVLQDTPEIHRLDLSETILGLLASGNGPLDRFAWIEAPASSAIENARQLLQNLDAIDDNNEVTPLGKEIASLNLHPRFGSMLMHAVKLDCIPAACVVAAIAQSSGIFYNTTDQVILQEREHEFGNPSSDLLFELNAWLWAGTRQFRHSDCSRLGINANTARQTGQLALQLLHRAQPSSKKDKKLPNENISPEEAALLRECIFTGFIDHLAIRHRFNSPTCQMMYGKSGKLHRDSIVQNARIMVATEMEETKSPTGVQLFLQKVSEVDESWLANLNMHGSDKTITELFDAEQKKVVRITEFSLNGLVLRRETSDINDDEIASRLLMEAILGGHIDFPQWDEDVEHFVRRVNFAAKHAPHYGIPAIDDEAKEFIIQQTVYHCRSVKDVQRCNLWPTLKAWFSYEQLATVDVVAPTTINLPRRKYPVKLRYDDKGDVILSETVQALYDLPLPVTVAEGKVSVVFEILAPSRRPVQITRDLDYFWKNSYHDVKKELKGRYPKHEWR
ncbi:MAG: ATP-dependent helicase HrpB [Bacteroidota bacterium]|nr:ATP-dependent helicase HrpB [Bacteroidota bacterium]